MTRTEAQLDASRPMGPRSVRLLLWDLLCLFVGAAMVSRYGVDTTLTFATGLLIGATVNSLSAWKRKRASIVWASMALVALR
jgi:hypothetical protein